MVCSKEVGIIRGIKWKHAYTPGRGEREQDWTRAMDYVAYVSRLFNHFSCQISIFYLVY